MRTIHKYKLKEGINTIQAHWIEQFLSVDMQDGNLVMWAQVDTAIEPSEYKVLVIGTSFNLDRYDYGYTYVGTTQNGKLVYHVFAKSTIEDTFYI